MATRKAPIETVSATLMLVKSSGYSSIARQIFSIITEVKNGTTAVRSLIDFLAVQREAKHEIPAIKRNTGIKMLENPYTEKRISPMLYAVVYREELLPGP